MTNTVRITDKPNLSGADSLIGILDGTTGPVSVDTLGSELVAGGPVADRLDEIEARGSSETLQYMANTIPNVEGGVEDWHLGTRAAYTLYGNPRSYTQTPRAMGGAEARNVLQVSREYITVSGFMSDDCGERVNAVRIMGALLVRDDAGGIVQDNGETWALRGPAEFETRAQAASFVAEITATNSSTFSSGDSIAWVGNMELVYTGESVITDMPGWVPSGSMAYFEQFAAHSATDNGATIQTAIEWAQSNNVELSSVRVDWPIATPIKTYATDGDCLTVKLPANCVLRATTSFPSGEMIVRLNASEAGATLNWTGGEFDGREMPTATSGYAPDLLRVHGPWDSVDIDSTIFRNNDEGDSQGDSGLMLYGASRISVADCSFYGAIDAGIYVSADPADGSGESITIRGCWFQYAYVGVISKREFKHHKIHDNDFLDCVYGSIIGGEADTTLLPGKNGLIYGNRYTRVTYPIEARISDYTSIYGNWIEEWGETSGGTLVDTAAILLNGSSNCIVYGNVIVRDAISHTSAAAVRMKQLVYDGTTYYALYNQVFGNNCRNAYTGVQELTGSDNGLYGPNILRGSYVLETVVGSNSRLAKPPRFQTPTSATASGVHGETRFDTSYFYVCTATNTWKRAALATW
ncbi:right-handed parallel beta-helix repeat-containing protein [Salipiger sp. 1_MG-2023]|uniref:right-handed parallel beta-helix repeat-containing protein n=1 Tax=Salipiger sp. 1_MG-2023 TaxID=3062665 RepID=UPI0026E2D328|nr:right-handed parallel beta-helix repeat-containing protein [Salipiger sp. 1_MG-2023]MDO6587322.1 right-handed parallel beta-helix repeat-containing protein [Salipiger sp. 1_MG-2023]